MATQHFRRWIALIALACLVLAACSSGEAEDVGGGGTEAPPAATDAPEPAAEDGDDTAGDGEGGTLVFGAAADPKTLDPALASDGESLRVSEQIYEGLVTFAPGTTDIVPALAESWEPSEDGTSYTFQLREGVTFHDGEPFNAEAVCFNFDRWYNFTGPLQLSFRVLLLAGHLRRLRRERSGT